MGRIVSLFFLEFVTSCLQVERCGSLEGNFAGFGGVSV